MRHNLCSLCLVFAGVLLSATSAPELVAAILSPAVDCRKSTQYDTQDDTIRDCEPIKCSEVDPKHICERGHAEYENGEGYTVTINYCSCDPFELAADPTGVCHVFRKHVQSTTTAECTDGTDCDGDKDCEKHDADVWPPVVTCKCQ